MTQNLRIVLKMFADFSDDGLDRITACFKTKSVVKNTILLQQGNVCKEFYFIHSGCIRTFFIDKNGREKTRYVMVDNHIGTSLSSFISQKPSVECVEALENTELLSIHHSDFYRLLNESDNWKNFYQKILELAYSFQTTKIEQLVTLTAHQRYDFILKNNPALIHRLSNRVLASFLDIREETLSRLKSK